MEVINQGNGYIELVSETEDEYRLLQRIWIHGIEVIEYDNKVLYQSITIKERKEDEDLLRA
jgi:hypothetical protein